MIDFTKVNFGNSDADTEAERNPEVFDPHNHLTELAYGDKFVVRGRKGDGKTAYGAKIKLMANKSDYHAHQRSLMNFNNTTFSQIKTYSNLGGNPYISFWKCVLMIEFVCMINKFEPYVQDEAYNNLVYTLQKHGFISPESDIVTTVYKLVETNTSIEISNFFSADRKRVPVETISGAEGIYSAIFNTIKNLYFTKKFIFIIDGLDDILNNDEFKSEIITGLIRATNYINQTMRCQTLKVKTLLLIRDDIWNLCRDPNLTKIQRDSTIRLDWSIYGNPFESDLLKLVERRVDLASGKNNSLPALWDQIFESKINGKNSIDYVLDNIIYRPRDILQFFIEAQKNYNARKFTVDNLQAILASYSNDYFLDALRDELTGFFPDTFVTKVPNILSKMGSQYFYLEDFEKECNKNADFKNISKQDVLERLFSAGYIGQHRPRTNREYTVFSYRNTRENFVAEHECILHRGLLRALSI